MSEGFNAPHQPAQPGGAPGGQPANVGSRFLAKLIDFILVGVVLSIVVGVIVAATLDLDDPAQPFSMRVDGTSILISVVFLVLTIAYFAVLESTQGRTVGKMALGLEVRTAAGRPPELGDAVKRNLWMVVQAIPYIGGVAWLVAAIAIAVTISNSPNGAGWHDNLGGTTVIKR